METSKDSWEMGKINEGVLILRHTRQMLEETAFTKQKFLSDCIVPALLQAGYLDDEPESLGADEYLKFMSNKRRALQYILDGRHRFPIEYKWPWINSLLPDYRDACVRDILALHGSLFVPLPNLSDCRMPVESNLYKLTKEFADVQLASSPAHDGIYSVLDGFEETQHFQDQLLELVEAALSEIRAIETGTGTLPKRIDVYRSILEKG